MLQRPAPRDLSNRAARSLTARKFLAELRAAYSRIVSQGGRRVARQLAATRSMPARTSPSTLSAVMSNALEPRVMLTNAVPTVTFTPHELTAGQQFVGDSAGDRSGQSVSGAGDVNGDGFEDIIVGAFYDDNNGTSSGSARVFSGVDGSPLFRVDGDAAYDNFGESVSGAGDVNGDGFDDIIVGAIGVDTNGSASGNARVFSGADAAILYTFEGDAAYDNFGDSVSGAGDVNGDGFDDVIVGAPRDDNNGGESGSARVFSGADGSILFTFNGDDISDFFGEEVSGAGDVNGDGFDDVVVGASGDDNSGTDSGSARVFSGADGSILFTFNGDDASDSFGRSVSGAGDVNSDGFDDIVVGAFLDDNNGADSGSARVFSGADGSTLFTFDGDDADDRFGRSVSDAGDVNGDGFDDIVVGAFLDDNNGDNSGRVRVFSGADGSTLVTFDGDDADDLFGFSVSGAGDLNGDGFADIVVGARADEVNGANSGSARVFLSQPVATAVRTFSGDDAYDYFGHSVADAGDVNGDGFDDIIAGAYYDDNNGENSGSARVLSGVDGTTLFTFDGDDAYDYFGWSVSGAGDVNGDGFDDVIVGTIGDDNSGSRSGSARVFSGADGNTLFTFDGDDADDDFGTSISGAGDVNGDGYDDLIVGAPGDDNTGNNSGSARVFSGADGTILFTFNGDDTYDRFGAAVSGAGDVNGDGFDDLIVGAYGDDDNGTYSGSARVFSGADGTALFTVNGGNAGDQSGRSVAGVGDINGDGLHDVIVGTPFSNDNGTYSGSARVFSGANGTTLFTFIGDDARDQFGYSVSGAGDVNGDGVGDIIVGAFGDANNGNYSGSARVFSGADGTTLFTVSGDDIGDSFGRSVSSAGDVNGDGLDDVVVGDPFNDDGRNVRVLLSTPQSVTSRAFEGNDGEQIGRSVSDIGDVNGDGFDDVIVGAPSARNSDDDRTGAAEILSGIDGTTLFRFVGDDVNDEFGYSVSAAGDVNGDGVPDVIVGASGDDNSGSSSGSARVFSGADGTTLFTFNGDITGDYFGRSVSGAGDVNGDGFDDVIVGASYDDNNGYESGSARVVSGADGTTLFTFDGDDGYDHFGHSVAGAGDVNGDGFDDLIVGAHRDNNNGSYSGSARVFSGVDGTTLFTVNGDNAFDYFGTSVSGAGDVNGDGFDDVIVGGWGDDTNADYAGIARVFSGVDGSVLHTFFGDAANDQLGSAVSGAGDVNGDGFDDLIVGAGEAAVTEERAGFARVFSGADGAVLATFAGDQFDGEFARAVSAAGDVNGDGFADVIVGAYGEDGLPDDDAGSVSIFLGSPQGFVPMQGPVQPFPFVGIGGRDDDVLSAVIVSIQGPTSSTGTDQIITPTALPTGVFTSGYNQATGEITFFGLAEVAVYEQLLRDLQITTSPFGGARTVSVQAIDTGGRIVTDAAEIGIGSAVILSDNFDFGDAPDSFSTNLASDGPRHQYSNLFLGSQIDVNQDAIESPDATGDDAIGGSTVGDGRGDDDGVNFLSPSARGQGGVLEVVASGPGIFAGWIDFDQSGTFDESERFESPVVAGANSVFFLTPGSAIVGDTFARFRLSSDADAVELPTGVARDGEVEDYAITVLQTQREWGDAPASYSAGGGTPFHNRGPNIQWLGAGRSLEVTPNLSADATGDDLDNGVTFLTPLAHNQPAIASVVASQPGELSYWVDFDNSGAFDAGEMFTKSLVAGNNLISFVTPGSAVLGDTFARFRFASSAVASPVGAAPNGEVEDYQVEIVTTQREFGDAPDSYSTSMASNGARHNLGPNTHFLGTAVDRESDGYVSSQADGDDTTNLNDDDGVTFTSLIARGQAGTVDVVASAPGELAYWIDFDLSGTFDNATERFTATLTAGTNSLTFVASNQSVVGSTYARFRFGTNAAQIANPFGIASNGEVEDYRVEIVRSQYDFGDAPASYGTTLDDGGAYHTAGSGTIYLGSGRDLESDGVPSGFADSDDNSQPANDEDGITFTSAITVGTTATFTAVASVGGQLSWWVDFNGNGVFDNPSERFQSAVIPGSNDLSFAVPANATAGTSYARFRFDTAIVDDPTGRVNDGEVEDYRVTIEAQAGLQAADSFFDDEDELAELLGSLS